ncbi:hypothetical protein [Alicyclobacillus herbarius]|uniref:hypothetical protein n=1 Tax=Alicyclobacillus herbarius TaxID=122960 RepID=UPI001FE0F299|nr:hypothetical protein [Alicyclobacillus herbarius]
MLDRRIAIRTFDHREFKTIPQHAVVPPADARSIGLPFEAVKATLALKPNGFGLSKSHSFHSAKRSIRQFLRHVRVQVFPKPGGPSHFVRHSFEIILTVRLTRSSSTDRFSSSKRR